MNEMNKEKNSKLQDWRCTSCRFLLGVVEDHKTVRIKRKDLYVEVEGGKIITPCVRCGKINYLVDHPDAVVVHADTVVPLVENKIREEEK